jgi:hypothetical protein
MAFRYRTLKPNRRGSAHTRRARPCSIRSCRCKRTPRRPSRSWLGMGAVPAHRLGSQPHLWWTTNPQLFGPGSEQLDHSGYNYPYPLERNTFDSHSSRVGRCLPAPGPGPMTVTVKSRCFSFSFNDTARLRRPRRALHPRETPYARAGLARPGRPLCLSIAATFVGSG